MFGKTMHIRAAGFTALTLLVFAVSGCSATDQSDIVAAGPHAVTITTTRFAEPTEMARAHCAKYHRNAVARGGIRLGIGYKTMWGFDCVDP